MALRATKCNESHAPFCCPSQSHGRAPLPHGRGSVRAYYSILFAIGAATVRERSRRDFRVSRAMRNVASIKRRRQIGIAVVLEHVSDLRGHNTCERQIRQLILGEEPDALCFEAARGLAAGEIA